MITEDSGKALENLQKEILETEQNLARLQARLQNIKSQAAEHAARFPDLGKPTFIMGHGTEARSALVKAEAAGAQIVSIGNDATEMSREERVAKAKGEIFTEYDSLLSELAK